MLTGEGADEFFGGYDRYRAWRELRKQGAIAKLVPDALWPLLPRYRYLRRYARYEAPLMAAVQLDVSALAGLFPGLNRKGREGTRSQRMICGS